MVIIKMTKEKFRLSDLTLIIWNPQRKLPYKIFLFRMFLVLFIMIGSLIYYIPNDEIPDLALKSYKLTRKSITEWSLETMPVKLFRLLIMIFIIVIGSRA